MEFYGFANKKKEEEEKKNEQGRLGEREREMKKEEEKKNYDNYNENEAYENKLENSVNQANEDDQLKETYIKRIEYDMSENKKQSKMKLEDKVQMELMRRWRVKIYNIYITPLLEMVDPFIQFTLGGDFSVDVYLTKKGDTYKVPKGSRGYSDKTEVRQNVDKLQKEPFDKVIDIEMRMSYAMVNSQKLMIELWDYNSIWMNTIKGYTTISMIDIVNGNVNQTIEIMKREKGKKNPSMTFY